MRLRIIAAPLLAVVGCFGADEPPAADQASPTQTAPDATVSETPVAEGVGQVPAVWGTCVSQEPLAAEDTDCPDGNADFPPDGDTVDMTAFVGQGFYNRGPPFPSTTYALRFPRQAATPTCARSTPLVNARVMSAAPDLTNDVIGEREERR